jgi:hypothetical protein
MLVELLGVPGCGKKSVIRVMEERLGYQSNLPPLPSQRAGRIRDTGRSLWIASRTMAEALGRPTPSPIEGIHPGDLARYLVHRSAFRITGKKWLHAGERDAVRRLRLAFAYYRSFTFSDHDTPLLVDGGPMRRLVQWFGEGEFFRREWVDELAQCADAYVLLLGDDPELVQARRKGRTKVRYRYKERPKDRDAIWRENAYVLECGRELVALGIPLLQLDHDLSLEEKAASIDAFLRSTACDPVA